MNVPTYFRVFKTFFVFQMLVWSIWTCEKVKSMLQWSDMLNSTELFINIKILPSMYVYIYTWNFTFKSGLILIS